LSPGNFKVNLNYYTFKTRS